MPPADPTRQPTGELLVPVAPTSTGYRIAKRGLDIGGALVGLLVTSPVLGIVAVAVKLDSPGPVLFRQIRLGRGGHPFTVLKFRTMHLSAGRAPTPGPHPGAAPDGRGRRPRTRPGRPSPPTRG